MLGTEGNMIGGSELVLEKIISNGVGGSGDDGYNIWNNWYDGR